jgi:hypothetical protein
MPGCAERTASGLWWLGRRGPVARSHRCQEVTGRGPFEPLQAEKELLDGRIALASRSPVAVGSIN